MSTFTKKSYIYIISFMLIILIGVLCCILMIKYKEDYKLSIKDEMLIRVNEIRNTINTNTENIVGNIYYISNSGDDNLDGRSPQTAWKTLSKLQTEFSNTIQNGDCILFNRGDQFRGNINVTKDNITIGSYGDETKQKSVINVSTYNAAYEGEWTQIEPNIWKYSEKINADVGAIWFFKNDNSLSNKHDWSNYSYEIGQKISFDGSFDESNLNLSSILDDDLKFYHTGNKTVDYDEFVKSVRSSPEITVLI